MKTLIIVLLLGLTNCVQANTADFNRGQTIYNAMACNTLLKSLKMPVAASKSKQQGRIAVSFNYTQETGQGWHFAKNLLDSETQSRKRLFCIDFSKGLIKY